LIKAGKKEDTLSRCELFSFPKQDGAGAPRNQRGKKVPARERVCGVKEKRVVALSENKSRDFRAKRG